mgnify:CR=1 FL=1
MQRKFAVRSIKKRAELEVDTIDNQVRAVVVTGAGRAFCAGMEMQPEDGGHVFGYDDAEGEERVGGG